MKRLRFFALFYLLALFYFVISCNYPVQENQNNSGNDTLHGWEIAGLNTQGDSSHYVDICHYQGNLFSFNYKGELFHCTYPELIWTQITVPSNDQIYDFVCDTLGGILYCATREQTCNVYKYEILNNKWHCLSPKNNPWFDSTKLYNGELYTMMYSIGLHKSKIFIMTAQGWTQGIKRYYEPKIWFSNQDTLWLCADSGWGADIINKAVTITSFFSIDDYLYASSFDEGLWRYNGVSWKVMKGTTPKDLREIADNGGDTKSIPGFRPRSMAKYNDTIFVGNLGGLVHKYVSDGVWDKRYMNFKDYNAMDTTFTVGPVMNLFSHNEYIIKGTYYFNDSANLWLNMTPFFNHIDPVYINALPGTVYGMTHIGDTLFAALGNKAGIHSGVYFLNLKKCKWYQK